MLPLRAQQSNEIGDETPFSTAALRSSHTSNKPIVSDATETTHTARSQNGKRSDMEASDDQHGQPKPKKMKLDADGLNDAPNQAETADAIVNNAVDCFVHATKIENLVELPVEMLLKIFDCTDDIDLLHLAYTCKRFAAIAKSYLINSGSMDGGPTAYSTERIQFGSRIILNNIEDIDENNWALKLLQPHINCIEKLTFNSCTFKSTDIFKDPLNIKHLTFRKHLFTSSKQARSVPFRIDLPACRNLTKLEVHNTAQQIFTWESLEQIIPMNPTLQSLLLYEWWVCGWSLWDMLTLIGDHVKGIKELALISETEWEWIPEPDSPDRIFNSFKHLESLALSAGTDTIDIVRQFVKSCKQIKHLELRLFGGFYDLNHSMVDVAESFQQIESFHYNHEDYYFNHTIEEVFGALVERLPNLRHLYVEPNQQHDIELLNVLSLLQKCPSLHQITIVFKYRCMGYLMPSVISARLLDIFIETINSAGKPNARLEVEEHGKIIGSVSANGIVWRKKLMYWTGCDQNDTNINLLHLADHPAVSAEQTSLLDEICAYLDLETLYSLAETSDQSERLISSYVEKQAKKQKTFIVTDEFFPLDDENYRWNWYWPDGIFGKLKFARFMTDLAACTVQSKYELGKIIERLDYLDKLSIYDELPQMDWPKVQSDLSHIVYHSAYPVGYSKLVNIVESFPAVETIKFKNADLFNDLESDGENGQKFRNLRKFTFNYRGDGQMQNLKKIFQSTATQLAPVFHTEKSNGSTVSEMKRSR